MSFALDLHVHSSIGSACSRLDLPDMIHDARAAGLDGIVVTDHESFRGVRIARRWGAELGFPVFTGVEIRTLEGDCLVYAVEEFDPEPYRGRSAQDLLDFARSIGAVMVVAHPYRRSAPSLGDHVRTLDGLAAVELYNGNCEDAEMERTRVLAAELELRVTGGSDAHGPGQVGRCYTEFESEIRSQDELLRALHRGAYRPVRPGRRDG